MIRRFTLAVLILLVPPICALPLGANRGDAHSAAYNRAEQKFDFIGENGKREHPSAAPTTVTAAEWNAYLNGGGVKLPQGLSGIRISSQPTLVKAEAQVDFDQLTAGKTRSNPLLALFTGKHQVTATAHASCVNGMATIHVQSVAFDGVEVPAMLLEFFASKYLRPRYGNAVGMDSTFAVKNRIDSATVGNEQVTIRQK